MNMQVRHALAHAIVDGDEGALRAEPFLHRYRQQFCIGRELRECLRRNIYQRLQVLARNEKAMAGKKRTMIEKSDCPRILKHNAGWNTAAGDLAEGASAHAVLSLTNRNYSQHLR